MFGRGGAIKLWEEKPDSMNERMNQLMTRLFIEQPLASPRSANYLSFKVLVQQIKAKCKMIKCVTKFFSVQYSTLCATQCMTLQYQYRPVPPAYVVQCRILQCCAVA